MIPRPDVDVDRRHPILVAHVARADGTAHVGLRVYCGSRGCSVPLETCRNCAGCHEVSDGGDGDEGWVRCTPPSEHRATGGRLLSVGDALQQGIVAVEEDVMVRDVITLFVERALRMAVVLDREGRVVGVVHDSLLAPQIQARPRAGGAAPALPFGLPRIADSLVSEVMSSATSIPERISLRTALVEMASARHQRVVVVDEQDRPVGILVDVHALRTLRSEEDRFR